MTERAKPFVAWTPMRGSGVLGHDLSHGGWDKMYYDQHGLGTGDKRNDLVPVVVTPLLPDDPRPGETWVATTTQKEYTVLSAPVDIAGGRAVFVAGNVGWFYVHNLRRPPVLKTFRMTWISGDGQGLTCQSSIQAESREAAIAILTASLTEVS